jgi:hypothetical protein
VGVLEITNVRRPSRWQGVEQGGTFHGGGACT